MPATGWRRRKPAACWCSSATSSSPSTSTSSMRILNSRTAAGWFETIDWMQKNRERAIDIVRRKTDVSLALATRDYDELSGMFNKTGRFNPEALKVLSRSFVEMGALPSEPDVSKLITEQYLPGKVKG